MGPQSIRQLADHEKTDPADCTSICIQAIIPSRIERRICDLAIFQAKYFPLSKDIFPPDLLNDQRSIKHQYSAAGI